jgi:hypothetical protein
VIVGYHFASLSNCFVHESLLHLFENQPNLKQLVFHAIAALIRESDSPSVVTQSILLR